MGTCQPQLQWPGALLELVQLWAEVEGTLRGEEAEHPAMGYPPSTPPPATHLPFLGSLPQHLQWPLRLRHSECRHTGLRIVGLVTWRCSGTCRNTPQKHKRRGKARSPYLKNAPFLPGNLLHGVPQDAGVVDAQGGDPTHHWCPGDAARQCPCCPSLHCGDIRPWQA